MRKVFVGCLVGAVLLAVFGLHQIREWFRPAAPALASVVNFSKGSDS
jgi:hypothetical protein